MWLTIHERFKVKRNSDVTFLVMKKWQNQLIARLKVKQWTQRCKDVTYFCVSHSNIVYSCLLLTLLLQFVFVNVRCHRTTEPGIIGKQVLCGFWNVSVRNWMADRCTSRPLVCCEIGHMTLDTALRASVLGIMYHESDRRPII